MDLQRAQQLAGILNESNSLKPHDFDKINELLAKAKKLAADMKDLPNTSDFRAQDKFVTEVLNVIQAFDKIIEITGS